MPTRRQVPAAPARSASQPSPSCYAKKRENALDAGTVWLNCSQVLWPATPFGGWKRSGWGKEFGAEGIDEFVRRKTVTTAPPGFSTQSYSGAGG